MPTLFSDCNYRYWLQGYAALSGRPELSSKIANIISIASNIELQLGVMLGLIIRDQSDIALSMYLDLSGHQRKKIIQKSTKYVFNDNLRSHIKELLTLTESCFEIRNLFAHGCFGYTDDDKDILLVIQVDKLTVIQANTLLKMHTEKIIDRDIHKDMKSNLIVYTKTELQEIEKAMISSWYVCHHVTGYIYNQNNIDRQQEYLNAAKSIQDIKISLNEFRLPR